MPAPDETAKRLALLIDADNIPPKLVVRVLEEARGLGTLVVRRAYGNYTTWSKIAVRKLAQEQAIAPVLVIPATTGKDAADLKLALDAIDLLHRGNLDGVCIASSDGDFTPLIMHIRENGLEAYGFGEGKAPEPYRLAFDRFFTLGAEAAERPARKVAERRRSAKTAPPPAPAAATPAARPLPPAKPARLPIPEAEVMRAVEDATRDGWAALSAVGHRLGKSVPGFTPRSYGSRNLRDMVAAIDGLETSEARTSSGNSLVRVRKKE